MNPSRTTNIFFYHNVVDQSTEKVNFAKIFFPIEILKQGGIRRALIPQMESDLVKTT